MAHAAVTPARALARFMVVALAAVLLTLAAAIGAIGVGGAVDPSGAAAGTAAQSTP